MGLMNLNLDGVLTEEKIKVPADGILHLGHDLFKPQPLTLFHGEKTLTRGQDYLPYHPDERLYYQKSVTLVTAIKVLNNELIDKELTVEYYACGDYINAEIWNEYPSSASLKQSLASKVDNSDFIEQIKRIDGDINKESTVRADADNTLQDNINIEANLRIAEDEKLQASINDEAVTRKTADDNLQAAINAEATDRQTADSAIRADLENETDLRLAGDSNLQTQISDLKTKFESFVPGLTYKVVSALPTADILNDVIYLVPADSTGSQSVYDEYIYIDGNWELIGTTATTQAITVDSALSETSTNPVQNKVVTAELKKMGKVYTSLAELGLTAPVTVGEIFNAMPNGTMAMIACDEIKENTQGNAILVSDVPTAFGILTIKKNAPGRFSIEYQNSLGGTVCNVRKWIGTLQGLDGTGLIWKELQDTGEAITEDTIERYGTEILKYPVGTWRIDSIKIGKQFTDLPLTEMAGIIEIDSIQPNKSPYEHGYAYRNYTIRDALTNNIYIRTLNSGNTVGTMQRDSGWQKIGISNPLGLVTNSQYFRISITKNHPAWYGNLKFSYVYGKTPTEVDITITSTIDYTITKGFNTIESITYTADGANITIGIKCTTTIYGTQTVEMPNEFGVINSLTEDVFTGDTTATLKEVNGYDVYSTTEQAIGTWIDGKTIYRKTLTKSPTSDQSNGNQVTIDVATISGLTNVIDIQATAKLQNYNNTSAPIYAKIPFGEIWRSNSGYSGAYVDSVYVEGTTLKLHANSCTSDDIYYVTVEYTK